MISFLPSYHETLVLPTSADTVYGLLSTATSNQSPAGEAILFTGWVKADRFRISMRMRRPNTYLPLVTGLIESTSSGCLLLMDYQLYPTTRLLITLWTIGISLAGIIIAFQSKNILFLLVSVSIIAAILFIVWSNFKLQLAPTRKAFQQLLF